MLPLLCRHLAQMFTCAAQPGLSRVVMNVIDFDGISIRTRNAKQVSAGPNNEAGWMIGKTGNNEEEAIQYSSNRH